VQFKNYYWAQSNKAYRRRSVSAVLHGDVYILQLALVKSTQVLHAYGDGKTHRIAGLPRLVATSIAALATSIAALATSIAARMAKFMQHWRQFFAALPPPTYIAAA
jgi:hypothetical protein